MADTTNTTGTGGSPRAADLTPSDSSQDFWKRHCSTPGGVICVFVYRGGDNPEAIAIFSDMEKVDAWLRRFADDSGTAVVVPYVIDEPDFGDVPAGRIV